MSWQIELPEKLKNAIVDFFVENNIDFENNNVSIHVNELSDEGEPNITFYVQVN